LAFNGQTYRSQCGIPSGRTGSNGYQLVMTTGTWEIINNCHGITSTVASGSIPSNVVTVQYVLTYNPNLGFYGGPYSAGTAGNGAPSPTPLTSNPFAGVTTISVSGNSANSSESPYQVQAIGYDSSNRVVFNSSLVFDPAVVGSA
jgi:hypothetical protein